MNLIEQLQKEKEAAEKKVIIGTVIIIIAVLAIFLLGEYMIFGMIMVIPGAVIAGIGGSKFSSISNRFKHEVLSSMIKEFVDDAQFEPSRGLHIEQVYDSEFIKRADRYHTEDFLGGTMDGVRFISSDVKLEERHVQHTKNGTRTYYETYFLGRMFIFEFNKDFDGYLQVLERGRPTSRRGHSKIKMESVVFNKKFKTYTTNDHSAFYVLTPHFMESLMKFEQNNRGTVNFSFKDDRLYIGINNNRDTFELKYFRKIDESLFDEFKRDLYVIKEVITELKLNKNIFK